MSTYVPYANLYSTAPILFAAFFDLVSNAAASQNPAVYVAPFELEQYEPASYVILSGITRQRFDIETLGYRSMQEYYTFPGYVSVYVGDSPSAEDPSVAIDVMNSTYAVFNSCVMSPAMSNRNDPVFGAQSPELVPGAINSMLPGVAEYSSGPGWEDNGAPVGWAGRVDFSFDLRGWVTPQ